MFEYMTIICLYAIIHHKRLGNIYFSRICKDFYKKKPCFLW